MKSLNISDFPVSGISVSAKIAINKNGCDTKITMPDVKWMEVFFHPFLIADKKSANSFVWYSHPP